MTDADTPSLPGLQPNVDTTQLGNLQGKKVSSPEKIDKAGEDFEAMFLSQMLAPMWAGIQSDSTFGGGSAEDTYHGMLVNEYGKLISKAGGLGIADAVKAELLKLQEKT
jgi:Rod binding domain-containing protein